MRLPQKGPPNDPKGLKLWVVLIAKTADGCEYE